ncbi:MAG TPA: glutathione S-transferase family protein [Tepidisphaeraceae bacterium]|nr:glutathione S-transferase family protein [Tepidisphaeraceae bacterium]
MLKIYGVALSRAFRVLWMANELGIRYEHVPVTFEGEAAQAKEPWYLEINPNGRVPTIDDDGFVMWESAAINLYLAEKYKSPLFPNTPQARGTMLQWAFFVANDVEPALISLFRHRFYYPPAQRDEAIASQSEATLKAKIGILEWQLNRTPCFGGETWNMADFMVASVIYTLPVRMKFDLVPWPKVRSWLMASIERPAALAARKLREPALQS